MGGARGKIRGLYGASQVGEHLRGCCRSQSQTRASRRSEIGTGSSQRLPARSLFHLFPLLIPELRRQIWEHALLRPPTMVRRWNNRKFSFALRRSVPPALHVCRETRLWFIQRSSTPERDSALGIPLRCNAWKYSRFSSPFAPSCVLAF
jgi:hypothetical protein